MKSHLLALAFTGCVAVSSATAERATDGDLKILYWQAVSILNPYLSSGLKDIESASMIIEPLARYNPQGLMVPFLAEDIPTLENGGVAEDFTSITWKLKKGIKWSDGTDFSADDVVFTADYCMHAEAGCQQRPKFSNVDSVQKLDTHTVKINFSVAKPFPYGPFVGAEVPIIQQAQFAHCKGARAPGCSSQNFAPLGTGAFRVVDFKPNDVLTLEANPYYRDPAKPAFERVILKGGGDAGSAARAVLETAEFDYAWNLQLEPEILQQMATGGKGEVVSAFGTSVERLMVNFTNPDPSLGGRRSTLDGGPHPFLTDTRVTRALSLAIDRHAIVDIAYGFAGRVSCNVLPAPAYLASTENDWCKTPDIKQARQLLDEAGWLPGSDGIREKAGQRLSLRFQTSGNSVRQSVQVLIKQMWQAIGVETELRSIAAAVFFGGDQSSPDTVQKFYADIQMYANQFHGTDAEKYLANWACDAIPDPSSQWLGMNMPRYCDPQYDALLARLASTGSPQLRAEITRELNDMLMQAGAIIPLIHRGKVSAFAADLAGVQLNAWDSELWNIADWSRRK